MKKFNKKILQKMKKVLFTLMVLLACVTVKAQISYPFGEPQSISSSVTTATTAIATNLYNNMIVVTMSVDTNSTVTLSDIDSELKKGAIMTVYATEATGVADTLTWSTGFTANTTPLVASKTKLITFIYNGTAFYKVAETQAD